jgi:hypothetical protein
MRQILLILLFAAAVTAAAAFLMEQGAFFEGPAADAPGEEETVWKETRQTLGKVLDSAGRAGREAARKGKETLDATGQELEKAGKKFGGESGKDDTSTGKHGSSAGSGRQIAFPRPVSGARFGMAPDAITQRYEIAWRRQSRGDLMLVHKIKSGATARFHFSRAAGLNRLEVRFQASGRDGVAKLYERIRSDYHQRYGKLPGSGRTRWTDGHIRARVERSRDGVALIFVPHR